MCSSLRSDISISGANELTSKDFIMGTKTKVLFAQSGRIDQVYCGQNQHIAVCINTGSNIQLIIAHTGHYQPKDQNAPTVIIRPDLNECPARPEVTIYEHPDSVFVSIGQKVYQSSSGRFILEVDARSLLATTVSNTELLYSFASYPLLTSIVVVSNNISLSMITTGFGVKELSLETMVKGAISDIELLTDSYSRSDISLRKRIEAGQSQQISDQPGSLSFATVTPDGSYAYHVTPAPGSGI